MLLMVVMLVVGCGDGGTADTVGGAGDSDGWLELAGDPAVEIRLGFADGRQIRVKNTSGEAWVARGGSMERPSPDETPELYITSDAPLLFENGAEGMLTFTVNATQMAEPGVYIAPLPVALHSCLESNEEVATYGSCTQSEEPAHTSIVEVEVTLTE